MRKFIGVPIVLLLLMALSACSDTKPGTISAAELTERENEILSTTSENSFVFNFDTDGDFKEVAVWLEKYEGVQLVNEKISHITSGVEKIGSIIFATTTNSSDKNKSFDIGIGSNGGAFSINGFDPDSSDLENMASTWNSFHGNKKLGEEEVVLASICYSSSGNISSFTEDFFDDPDTHMDELNKCDVAYLLKAEFKK